MNRRVRPSQSWVAAACVCYAAVAAISPSSFAQSGKPTRPADAIAAEDKLALLTLAATHPKAVGVAEHAAVRWWLLAKGQRLLGDVAGAEASIARARRATSACQHEALVIWLIEVVSREEAMLGVLDEAHYADVSATVATRTSLHCAKALAAAAGGKKAEAESEFRAAWKINVQASFEDDSGYPFAVVATAAEAGLYELATEFARRYGKEVAEAEPDDEDTCLRLIADEQFAHGDTEAGMRNVELAAGRTLTRGDYSSFGALAGEAADHGAALDKLLGAALNQLEGRAESDRMEAASELLEVLTVERSLGEISDENYDPQSRAKAFLPAIRKLVPMVAEENQASASLVLARATALTGDLKGALAVAEQRFPAEDEYAAQRRVDTLAEIAVLAAARGEEKFAREVFERAAALCSAVEPPDERNFGNLVASLAIAGSY